MKKEKCRGWRCSISGCLFVTLRENCVHLVLTDSNETERSKYNNRNRTKYNENNPLNEVATELVEEPMVLEVVVKSTSDGRWSTIDDKLEARTKTEAKVEAEQRS